MPKHKKDRRNGSICGKYSVLPKTALAIFILTAAISKSGAAEILEAAAGDCALRFARAKEAFMQDPSALPQAPDPKPEYSDIFEPDLSESPAPVFYSPPASAEATAVTIDGSSAGYTGSGAVYIKNETDYAVDTSALLAAPDKVKLSGDKVQVLIMHTHGTEAYTPTPENSYTPTDTDRTTDSRYNVLRVGQEICDILNSRGIKTVHSETLNDSPTYSGSYSPALDDISRYIKENPSIKLVIDVHRDAMISASGKKYKTVADINGGQAAQLMLVCGTDAGGLVHDGWRDNLSFQLKLQSRINTGYPGLMRPLNIRKARFNQHVTTGSMLLEVGTSGNTLEEALVSARIFAGELCTALGK